MKKTIEEIRRTDVAGEYDVVVVGGGPSGIAASVASARSGAKTLLIERYGFLGGMATVGMVGTFCGFYTTGPQKKMIVGGIGREILKRLGQREGLSEKRISKVDPRIAVHHYHPEIFKVASEEMALQHGVEILFHSLLVDVIWKIPGNQLSGVIVETKSGRLAFLGKIFIDTTGDGDVAYKAGVPYEIGDEHGNPQALTTMFRMIHVDLEKVRELDLRLLKEKLAEAREKRIFQFHRVDGILNLALPEGIVSANITGVPHLSALNAIEFTKAEIEGRRQIFEYLRFLRQYIPGFERASISSIAPQIGVRETRRIQGLSTLREDDVIRGNKSSDGIALGAWPVEIHDPQTGNIQWQFLEREDDYYTIPFGCLIPQHVNNLLVAGRCISATHIAQGSSRVMAQAFAMGEAAGTVASESVTSGILPREIDLKRIQNQLKAHEAILEI